MASKAHSDTGLQSADMAFAIAIAASGGGDGGDAPAAPEWIQIFPAPKDGVVRARPGDDREWRLTDAAALIANHDSRTTEMMLDYDHMLSKMDRWTPVTAPAAGWFSSGAIEQHDDGSVWARPDYTPAGRLAVANREYRYASPTFMHDSDGNIVALEAIALVNDPAFTMQALASRNEDSRRPESREESTEMKMTPAMLAKLGLKDDATEEQVMEALASREPAPVPAAPPAPEVATAMTPTADLELARRNQADAEARATAAEEKVALAEAETFGRDVDGVLDRAEAAKKTAPSSRAYHRANCFRDEKPYPQGLEELKKHLDDAPPVVTESRELASKNPPSADGSGGARGLTAEQAHIQKLCGTSDKELEAVTA